VRDAVTALPEDLFTRYFGIISRIEAGADPRTLGSDSKPMGDGLFEFRLQGQNTIGRVFYGYLKGQIIIVLHSIVKKSQATPKKELDLARGRLKVVIGNAGKEKPDG
jgi:phage-related protein